MLKAARWRFHALPNSICQLSQPRWLNLCVGDVASLPEELRSLESLSSLQIMAQNLRALPESPGQLESLKELELSKCQHLPRLPHSITRLVGLQFVRLWRSKSLAALPLMDGQLPGSCHCTVTSCQQQQQPGGVRNVEREDDAPMKMDESRHDGSDDGLNNGRDDI